MNNKSSNIRSKLILFFVLSIGWVLRVVNLGQQSLWQNEIISHKRATAESLSIAHQLLLEGNHAPMYELGVLRPLFQIAGHSEFLHRLPSAIFGLLTICLVYIFAKEVFEKNVGLLAMIVIAINPVHIYYSREGRMYGLLAFVITLAFYFLQKAYYTNSRSRHLYLTGYAVSIAIGLYTHYYAGLTILAVSMVLFGYLIYSRDIAFGMKWILANLGAACLFLPWVPTFLAQLKNDPVSHIATPTLSQMVKLPSQFFTNYTYVPSSLALIASIGIFGLFGLLLVGLYLKSGPTSRPFQISATLALVFCGTLALAYVLSLLITPMISLRYFIALIPILSLLIGAFIGQFENRYVMSFLLSGFVLVNSYFVYDVLSTVWRKEYGKVAHIISESEVGDAKIVLFSPGGGFWLDEFNYYFPATDSVVYQLDQQLDTETLNGIISDFDETTEVVWLIQTNFSYEIKELEQGSFDYKVVDQQNFPNQFFFSNQLVQLTQIETGN